MEPDCRGGFAHALSLLLQRRLAGLKFAQAVAQRLTPCTVLDCPEDTGEPSLDIGQLRI
jgi:hypothetical protein